MGWREDLLKFATSKEGLNRYKGDLGERHTVEDFMTMIRDEDGEMFGTVESIQDALEKNKKVYAYSSGSLMPCELKMEKKFENGEEKFNLSLGENLGEPIPKPPKVNFFHRFLSLFSKNMAERVKNYDAYTEKKKIQDNFEKRTNTRKGAADFENNEKAVNEVDDTHKAQKDKINSEMSRLKDQDPRGMLEAHNTWHTVPYNRMCYELGRRAKLADPGLSLADREKYENEYLMPGDRTGKDGASVFAECEKLGHRIFTNAFMKANKPNATEKNTEVLENILANVVTKKPTDKEARDFDNFLKMGHVPVEERSDPRYEGYDFENLAAETASDFKEGAATIITEASKLMNKQKSFGNLPAYLAMSAQYAQVNGDTTADDAYNSVKNVSSHIGIVKMGETINNLQNTLDKALISAEDSESIGLDYRPAAAINMAQLMIGSFVNKNPGARSGFEDFFDSQGFMGDNVLNGSLKERKLFKPDEIVTDVSRSSEMIKDKSDITMKNLAGMVLDSRKIEAGYNKMASGIANNMLAKKVDKEEIAYFKGLGEAMKSAQNKEKTTEQPVKTNENKKEKVSEGPNMGM